VDALVGSIDPLSDHLRIPADANPRKLQAWRVPPSGSSPPPRIGFLSGIFDAGVHISDAGAGVVTALHIAGVLDLDRDLVRRDRAHGAELLASIATYA
jgi:hypothetical protein